MYAYFEGEIIEKNVDYIVIECNGVGYQIMVSSRTLQNIGNVGDVGKVYTHFHVRQEEMALYGFLSVEEKRMFEKMITVNGIGPKAANSILSVMTVTELAVALVSEDATAISRAKGIGKKIALRLILELKEKVDNDELTGAYKNIATPQMNSIAQEALAALMALGFTSLEASRAVSSVESYNTVEELITTALKSRGA
jgi:Holliday junction DNA helicase RuvA